MRICDWSSAVCSSDRGVAHVALQALALVLEIGVFDQRPGAELLDLALELFDQIVGVDGRVVAGGIAGLGGDVVLFWLLGHRSEWETGRASCWDRVCQYV